MDYLESVGCTPAYAVGNQWVYYSPFTQERTPSFFVDPKNNVWNDFSSGEKGDIIRLVRLLHQCSFAEAIELLQNFTGRPNHSFFFSGSIPLADTSGLQITKVKKLENKALIEYLQHRAIPYQLAVMYVQEAYYLLNGKYRSNGMPYFSLAFPNDKGGFELRRKDFKSCAAPKCITTIYVPDSTCLNVFESFTDFLSALVFFKTGKPSHITIILNSLTCLHQIIPILPAYRKVYVYFDLDQTGKQGLITLRSHHLNTIDMSYLYANSKDFNDFLTSSN